MAPNNQKMNPSRPGAGNGNLQFVRKPSPFTEIGDDDAEWVYIHDLCKTYASYASMP
jgi:hypothetical protein